MYYYHCNEKELEKLLSESFREYLWRGYPIDINGERYKTTGRGDVSVRMYDSRLYDALYTYLLNDGEKPELCGEASVVVERYCDLTQFLVKWELRTYEYEKKKDEHGKLYLDIAFIRWGGEV